MKQHLWKLSNAMWAENVYSTVRAKHGETLKLGSSLARALSVSVTFEPGARTAWHTHTLGQTLIVTAGCGWVESEGGPKEEIRPGDVVRCPPAEKH